MAYTKVWPEGWKDNEEGGTYINAAGLNKMEQGIVDAHEFMARTDNPHKVTKTQVGLGNVPNVTTNDQTPTYTAASTLTALASGEKLSVVFSKLAKAVTNLISHLADNVRHITTAERTAWNKKVDGVKGNTESSYRTGNVNITPANIGALPLSGGTLTGDLTLKSKNIKYQGTKSSYTMIGFIDNENDTYGNGMYIGGGGAVVVGGGESASTIASDTSIIANGGSESLILANDGDIDFYSNVQSGVSNAKKMTLTNAGQLTLPSTPDGDMSAVTKQYVDGKVSKLESLIPYMEIYKSASGNPVQFSDGSAFPVRELFVALTPTQSGSGDPYPPGGGKNQCPIEVGSTTTNGLTFTVNQSAGTVTVDGTASAQTLFYLNALSDRYAGNNWILTGCPDGGNDAVFSLRCYKDGNGYGSDTGSGCAITGTEHLRLGILVRNGVTMSNRVFSPMLRLASETDSTFEPYSNIRPITGVRSVRVTGTGKNLLYNPVMSTSGFTLTSNSDGSVHVTGGRTSIAFLNFPDVPFSETGYILSCIGLPDGTYAQAMEREQPQSSNIYVGNVVGTGETAITFHPGMVRYTIRVVVNANTQLDDDIRVMLRPASISDSAFAPYQSWSVVTVSTGDAGTVYGGTLNVTTGELTVTHQCLDLDTLTWGHNANGNYAYVESGLENFGQDPVSLSGTPYLSSHFLYGHAYFGNVMALYVNSSNLSTTTHTLYVPNADALGIGSAEELQSWFTAQRDAGTPVQVYAELKQPLTYQLTGRDLATFSGSNTVFTDAGSVTVRYRADPTLAYEELESSLTNAILSLGANF